METEKLPRNIHLFAMPSFITGVARIIDPFGTLNIYNRSKHPDYYAMLSDWKAVGDDMRQVIREYGNTVDQNDGRERI